MRLMVHHNITRAYRNLKRLLESPSGPSA
jgi:hypothetical protein